MMNRIRLFLTLLILYIPLLSVAATTVRIEPEQISQQDTFRLILLSDEINRGGLPNLTPLQKEFTIIGTEHNVSYNMVNGQTNSYTQWIILLRPKKSGTLTIPAIQMGSEQTKPSSITVLEGDAPTNLTDEPQTRSVSDAVMLKTQISETNPYVNQQILYTVKLYNNQRLIGAQYQHPSVQDALIIPLGEERHYQTQENDQTYAVEEQQYAIFPQKSGPLVLTPPSFETAIFDAGYPKRIRLQGEKTPVTIRPAPANYHYKNWLPAKKVTLAETYDVPTNAIKEGDTITRTVTLQALAMPAQLLPLLEFTETPQFKVYPESPEIKNTIKPNELIGISTIKVTYLLSKAGNITVPKLEVPWFNVTTGKAEVASLPPHTITVQAVNGTAKKIAVSDTTISPKPTPTDKLALTPNPSPSTPYSLIFAVGIGFISGLTVVLLFVWLRRSPVFATSKAKSTAIKRVLRACEQHAPNETQNALLHWAKIQWPEKTCLNLHDIAMQCRDVSLKKELLKLSQSLYASKTHKEWQGLGLRESFRQFCQSNGANTAGEPITRPDLPPINP